MKRFIQIINFANNLFFRFDWLVSVKNSLNFMFYQKN